MTINLVLISLQTLFLLFYGVEGLSKAAGQDKKHWTLFAITSVVTSIACFLLKDFVAGSIQLLLLFSLLANYLLFLWSQNVVKWGRTFTLSILVTLTCAISYFQWQSDLIWMIAPFGLALLCWLTYQQVLQFSAFADYFLKAGVLLTVLLALEPISNAVLQNLKPVPTIPLDAINSWQNFLLLGTLVMLAFGGFVWKEKTRS